MLWCLCCALSEWVSVCVVFNTWRWWSSSGLISSWCCPSVYWPEDHVKRPLYEKRVHQVNQSYYGFYTISIILQSLYIYGPHCRRQKCIIFFISKSSRNLLTVISDIAFYINICPADVPVIGWHTKCQGLLLYFIFKIEYTVYITDMRTSLCCLLDRNPFLFFFELLFGCFFFRFVFVFLLPSTRPVLACNKGGEASR